MGVRCVDVLHWRGLEVYFFCFVLIVFFSGFISWRLRRMENMLQGIERVALQGVDGFVNNDGVEEKEAQKEAQGRETSMSVDSLDGTGDPSLFR